MGLKGMLDFSSSGKPHHPLSFFVFAPGSRGGAKGPGLNRSTQKEIPPSQWIFQVPVKGGRDYRIPQLAVYTTYIPLIYCLLGDYIIPTTFYGNQKQPLTRVGFVKIHKSLEVEKPIEVLFFWEILSPKTNGIFAPENRPKAQKRNESHLPSIHFHVQFASFWEGTWINLFDFQSCTEWDLESCQV